MDGSCGKTKAEGGVVMDIAYAWTCQTNESFGPVIIESAKGRNRYEVSWGRLFGKHANRIGAQYGPNCTCKGFDIRSDCKHVKEMESQRCGWNATLEPGVPCKRTSTGSQVCPDCSGAVSSYRVAI